MNKVCIRCGKPYESSCNSTKYCSAECKKTVRACKLCGIPVEAYHTYCQRCSRERKNASRDKNRSYLHDEEICLTCEKADCTGICGEVIDACALRRIHELEVADNG